MTPPDRRSNRQDPSTPYTTAASLSMQHKGQMIISNVMNYVHIPQCYKAQISTYYKLYISLQLYDLCA